MDALSGCFALDDVERPVSGRLCPLHWPKAICKVVGCSVGHPSRLGSSQTATGSKEVLLNMAKRGTDSVGKHRLISTHLST